MRHFACPFLAAVSLLWLAPGAPAESRPRYGGTFIVELHAAPNLTDPGEWPVRLVPLVYDRLVRLDNHGEPQPALAASWQPDASNRHWEFRLRPHILFHDGSPVTAQAVAACLKDWVNLEPAGETVIFQSETPAPDLPLRLAGSRGAILLRGADGATVGTGPFRITEWQPGKHALLSAFEGYWAGRPFVDFVELRLGRASREQAIDLDLGKADLIEIPVADVRRAAQQAVRQWTSAPCDLWALLFDRSHSSVQDSRLREAIALSIDRDAIHNVLLQGQGESTGAILPAWLSGYSFLFPPTRDLDRTRQLAASVAKPGTRISLAYDPADSQVRPIADRVVLNAREAGLILQAVPGAQSAVRLVRLPLRSLDAWEGLAEMSALLHTGTPPPTTSPEALFAFERKLLEDFRLVPLFHLPEIYGVSSRVRNWEPQPWGDWRIDNVWLETRTP